MTPHKRKKANIQNMKDFAPKKEGVRGWLTYVSWSLLVFVLAMFILFEIAYRYHHQPSFLWGNVCLLSQMITILLIPAVMWASSYWPSKWLMILTPLFFLLMIGIIFTLEIVFRAEEVGFFAYSLTLIIALGWHIYYFYRRSKNGYRHVWLKAILFALILPLVLLFFDLPIR